MHILHGIEILVSFETIREKILSMGSYFPLM